MKFAFIFLAVATADLPLDMSWEEESGLNESVIEMPTYQQCLHACPQFGCGAYKCGGRWCGCKACDRPCSWYCHNVPPQRHCTPVPRPPPHCTPVPAPPPRCTPVPAPPPHCVTTPGRPQQCGRAMEFTDLVSYDASNITEGELEAEDLWLSDESNPEAIMMPTYQQCLHACPQFGCGAYRCGGRWCGCKACDRPCSWYCHNVPPQRHCTPVPAPPPHCVPVPAPPPHCVPSPVPPPHCVTIPGRPQQCGRAMEFTELVSSDESGFTTESSESTPIAAVSVSGAFSMVSCVAIITGVVAWGYRHRSRSSASYQSLPDEA